MTRLYVEYHCISCKRNHMISREAAMDRETIKKCPHCLSPKVGPTGMLGFTATNTEIKAAVEKGIGIIKEMDDELVQDTIDEMRRTTDDHQKERIAENLWKPEPTDIIGDIKKATQNHGGELGPGDDGTSGHDEYKEPELPQATVLNPAEETHHAKRITRAKAKHH